MTTMTFNFERFQSQYNKPCPCAINKEDPDVLCPCKEFMTNKKCICKLFREVDQNE